MSDKNDGSGCGLGLLIAFLMVWISVVDTRVDRLERVHRDAGIAAVGSGAE